MVTGRWASRVTGEESEQPMAGAREGVRIFCVIDEETVRS